ncbi:MAG TPA: glycosyltransferase family 2 protein [Kiritimatiellia bacterium]|nr:glycosyltransferase family 2 protein [Kiritimatiellia bacterium]
MKRGDSINSASAEESLELSIVIPCYNEINRLPRTMKQLETFLQNFSIPLEIVVVDDGSRDETATWVRKYSESDRRVRLVSYGGNRGKGYAVTQGMLAAKGRYRVFMDADGSTPVEYIENFLRIMKERSADIVIGSRKEIGAQLQATQSLPRRSASQLFALLTRLLVVYGVKDTQCGFKMFTKEASDSIFSRTTVAGAIFDIELMLLAADLRYRVAEIPVTWTHDDDSRLTYNLRKSLMIFVELMRVKFRHRILLPRKVQPA